MDSGLIWMRALMPGRSDRPAHVPGDPPHLLSEAKRLRAITVTSVATFLGLPPDSWRAGSSTTTTGLDLSHQPAIVLLGLIGIWLFIPEMKDPAAQRLDWLGAILVVIGV